MSIRTLAAYLSVAAASLLFHTPLAHGESIATPGPTLDTLILGDIDSEKAHSFVDERSEAIRGGFDEPARHLLPLDPPSYHGGTLSFTVRVDPQQQNYLTLKLWGSDKGEERGRLILFAGDLQIGYRSEGDYDVLNHCGAEGLAPGRWVYQTAILPLALTSGKTSIDLTIRSFGPVWWYGPNFEKFQKNLTVPSRGMYRIYSHTDPRFVPAPDEVQGRMESRGIRPGPGEEVIGQSKQVVIDRLNKLLAQTQKNPGPSGTKAREARLALLAEAYHVPWTPAFKDPRALDQIIQDADDSIRAAVEDASVIEGNWLGLGPVGAALLRTWPDVNARMHEQVSLGVDGATTRGQAWAIMLRRSADYWRTHRRGYTNQSMIVDFNIYTANRGLRLLDPEVALPEDQAIRYLYEAVGLEPWRGSDIIEGADPTTRPDSNEATWRFGDSYRTITRKGLSREVGWVGSYGETILTFMREMVDVTNDARIREQLRLVQKQRFFFRYPALDRDGYQCMKLTSEIDNRTANYPKSGAAYNASEVRESWWMEVPAMFAEDPSIVGVAQQALADNQYFAYIEGRLKDPNTLGMMRNVDDYAKVKAALPSDYRLPTTDGQPDFVFSDEENAVVAVKHGDTRLFVNLYYRSFYGINGVARILEVTPQITRIATAKSQFRIGSTVGTYTRPDFVHWQYGMNRGHLPPGELPRQALAGEQLPVAAPPEGVKPLSPPTWGPFAGKADYYELRWGDYLIAVNTTVSTTHKIQLPKDSIENPLDLATQVRVDAAAGDSIEIKPLSTKVLFLR